MDSKGGSSTCPRAVDSSLLFGCVMAVVAVLFTVVA